MTTVIPDLETNQLWRSLAPALRTVRKFPGSGIISKFYYKFLVAGSQRDTDSLEYSSPFFKCLTVKWATEAQKACTSIPMEPRIDLKSQKGRPGHKEQGIDK